MPNFQGEEALNYDKRITKLVPAYHVLHQITAALCQQCSPDNARILVVGVGTGQEIINLAAVNPHWHFVAQDTAKDMLNIAEKRIAEAQLSARVTFHHGDLSTLSAQDFDTSICMLVMHFLPDNGDKQQLLNAISTRLKPSAWLLLADLMKPQSQFEREAQLQVCQQLGLSENGVNLMRNNLNSEFFPLDRLRFADLLADAQFGAAKSYFKALGFTGVMCQRQ